MGSVGGRVEAIASTPIPFNNQQAPDARKRASRRVIAAMTDKLQTYVSDVGPSMTIREFCALERMSKVTYHKLKRNGLGPDELRAPGMTFVRITPAARLDWHARMAEMRKSEAVEKERQQRSDACRVAGKLAAASPNHHSKKRAGARQKRRA